MGARSSAGRWRELGAVYTPRIGTEVAIGFVEGDIDRPVILGQLYNGVDTPPFSAGIDSGVNHPGVISGVHTQTLDQSSFNQWVVDDASGQLRMRLLAGYSNAELGLGHLIQQSSGSAIPGQFLPGGTAQAVIEVDQVTKDGLKALGDRVTASGKPESWVHPTSGMRYEIKPTGWKDANGIWGYVDMPGQGYVQTLRLSAREAATKDNHEVFK